MQSLRYNALFPLFICRTCMLYMYDAYVHARAHVCEMHVYVYIIACTVAFMTRLRDNCNGHSRNAQPHYRHSISQLISTRFHPSLKERTLTRQHKTPLRAIKSHNMLFLRVNSFINALLVPSRRHRYQLKYVDICNICNQKLKFAK